MRSMLLDDWATPRIRSTMASTWAKMEAKACRICSRALWPWATSAWVSLMVVTARSTSFMRALFIPAICATASWVCAASLRTSSATTAKPRPCSPALAASMAALRGQKVGLVRHVGDELQHQPHALSRLGHQGNRILGLLGSFHDALHGPDGALHLPLSACGYLLHFLGVVGHGFRLLAHLRDCFAELANGGSHFLNGGRVLLACGPQVVPGGCRFSRHLLQGLDNLPQALGKLQERAGQNAHFIAAVRLPGGNFCPEVALGEACRMLRGAGNGPEHTPGQEEGKGRWPKLRSPPAQSQARCCEKRRLSLPRSWEKPLYTASPQPRRRRPGGVCSPSGRVGRPLLLRRNSPLFVQHLFHHVGCGLGTHSPLPFPEHGGGDARIAAEDGDRVSGETGQPVHQGKITVEEMVAFIKQWAFTPPRARQFFLKQFKHQSKVRANLGQRHLFCLFVDQMLGNQKDDPG